MSTASKDLELELLRKREEEILTSEPRSLWQSTQEVEEKFDATKAKRSQEFSADQKEDESLLNPSRRRFLQWMGAATALMTSSACKRRPVDTLVPYVNKPQGVISGVPVWYASSASNGFGILVKTREGRPIKIEGNPDHPVNLGAIDASTQAALLDLYNPERVKGALKSGKAVAPKDADAAVKEILIAARPGAVRVLTGAILSPTLKSNIDSLVGIHKGKHHTAEPFGRDRVAPNYRFDKADVVVSVDSDFLGAHPRSVEFTKQFSKRRKIHRGDANVNRLFVFESNFTITGVAADHRSSIAPSNQLSILYALANYISGRASVDPSLKSGFSGYSIEKVSQETGVVAEELKAAAEALLSARGKSLVLAGAGGPESDLVQQAASFLNFVLQNYSSTIETSAASISGYEGTETYESLLKDAADGKVDVLVVCGTNPVYQQVNGEFDKALSKIKNLIVVSAEMNETAAKAQFVFGQSHFLETWGDSEIRSGIVSIQQPVIEPLFDTRSFGETLLAWMQSAPVDYRTEVQNFWKRNYFPGGGFDSWWNDQLRKGATIAAAKAKGAGASKSFSLKAGKAKADGLELVLYETVHLRDGAQASNAWLQELPDAVSKVTWSNYVAVSSQLAKKMGFRENLVLGHHSNDVALIKVGDKSIELPVHIQPGLKSNVIAIPLGYGRTHAGAVGSDVGKNALTLASRDASGLVQLSGLKVEISKTSDTYSLATTQRHFELQGRDHDILQRATLADFLKDPKAGKHGGPHEQHEMSMYDEKEFVYPGHKWGMAIDLNSCTGCQACVVACYSENNISVAGEDQVRKGRHMAWLRMDLYYSGDMENPESAELEPMLCQQCTTAPCETVCPVLATVHSSDGLNDMVYNRCVGTRYCANNCPYKVRRFNYFQYSDSLGKKIDFMDPLPMTLNPDVTVRSRGVMEKCTFCVQRIRRTVDEFKDRNEKLRDGAIQTACQQSCPADAIVFGDLNDEKSEVSKLSKMAQGFKVLEVLNTRPSVTYLPRIRNKGTA